MEQEQALIERKMELEYIKKRELQSGHRSTSTDREIKEIDLEWLKIRSELLNKCKDSGLVRTTKEYNPIPKYQKMLKKEELIVWEFMYMLTRPKWQESYGWYTGNPPPRAGSLTDKVLGRSPELKTFGEAMNQAKASYLPTGFEEQFSEFSKFVTSAVMEIVTTDRTVEDVVNELQRSLEKKFL